MATRKKSSTKKSSSKNNLNAALTYLAGWVTGLIFLLVEKKDKFVRFHAAQSIVVFGAITLISFVPVIGWVFSIFIVPVSFILWLILIIKAYQGENFRLPIVSDLADQIEAKIK